MFSDEAALLTIGQPLLVYVTIFPIIAFASYIWDGVFVGLTATNSMRNAMIIALVIFLATYYMLTPRSNGSHIWMALSVFMIARAVLQYGYYYYQGVGMK